MQRQIQEHNARTVLTPRAEILARLVDCILQWPDSSELSAPNLFSNAADTKEEGRGGKEEGELENIADREFEAFQQ